MGLVFIRLHIQKDQFAWKNLVKGLSDEIGGKLTIENKDGKSIKILFTHDTATKKTAPFALSSLSNNWELKW